MKILPISLVDMKIAQQLRMLLKQRGTTVANLARATKTESQTIHNWLAGSKPRDFDQVKRVADYFDVTLDMLVYGANPATERKNTIDELKEEINAGVFEVILRKIKK